MMKSQNSKYRIKMKDLPEHDRPRERIIGSGVDSLSNSELLSAILGFGSGNEGVMDLSNRIMANYSLEKLSRAGVSELKKIFGISDAKACRIIAAMEIGRRAACEMSAEGRVVESPADLARVLVPRMRNLRKEFLRGIYLDSKRRIIGNEIISVGGLNTNSTHPREVFGPALRESAAALVLVHNHPSGDPAPSKDDLKVTRKLSEAGRLVGIELLDHLIIGKNGYVSLMEEGIL
jgi:DNA repair protein RadC